MESSQTEALGGNCDIDVDECASGPCANGVTCTESASGVGGVVPRVPMHVCGRVCERCV